MKIEFVFPTNRKTLLDEVRHGLSPDNGLYGFSYFRELGMTAEFADVPQWLEHLLDQIFAPISWWWKKQTDITFQFGRALLSLRSLNRADVVLTNTDSIGMSVCFLKRLGLVRPPVVYAVSLFYIKGALKNAIDANKKTPFLRFFTWILSAAAHIVYHSPIEKEKLVKLGLYHPAYCTFVAMGSDAAFFKNAASSKFRAQNSKKILSLGRDHARDYETLFRAAEKLPKERFVVICSQRNIDGLHVPGNIQILKDLPYSEVREWYKKASVVVIPMKEMYRSSGQMTLTDSFQAGVPIITSDVIGITHYGLRHERDAVLVSPDDPSVLSRAIRHVMEDSTLKKRLQKAARRLAKRFTTKQYAVGVLNVIQQVVDGMRLRPIERKDVELLRTLRNENRQYFYDDQRVSKQMHKQWYLSYLKKKRRGTDYMFILEDHGQSRGSGAIYNIDWRKRSAEIGRFIIEKRWRGKGYGKKLLEKIERVGFGELGMKTLTLGVLAENQTAAALYRRASYRQSKLVRANGKKVVMMSKPNILQSFHAASE